MALEPQRRRTGNNGQNKRETFNIGHTKQPRPADAEHNAHVTMNEIPAARTASAGESQGRSGTAPLSLYTASPSES